MKLFSKLTAWLLTLAMLMTLLPGFTLTASAAESYDLWVGGERFTSDNLTIDDVDGDGTATYDPDTNTLTLDDYNYTGAGYEYAAIYYGGNDTLNLVLEGTNSVTHIGSASGYDSSLGLYSNGSITIDGDGSLTATAGEAYFSYGVFAIGSITVGGGSLRGEGGEANDNSYGVAAIDGITVKCGEVVAEGNSRAFSKAPTIADTFNNAAVWYGENEEAANAAGPWDKSAIEYNYDRKYIKIAESTGELATLYPLWVGGERFTSDNLTIDDVDGDGTATYDPESNTLTLDDYNYTGEGYVWSDEYFTYGAAIYYGDSDTLNLVLKDTNSVTHTGNASGDSFGVQALGNITISGDGSLTATGGTGESSIGVFASGGIIVKGGSLRGEGGEGDLSYGVGTNDGITVSGGSLTGIGGGAVNDSYGVLAWTGITVLSGSLHGEGGEAKYSYGVLCVDIITVEGGSLTGIGGEATYDSHGVEFYGSMTVSGGEVVAEGNTQAFYPKPNIADTFNNAAVWYGENEEAANAAGTKNISELSANYSQKYVKIAEDPDVIKYTVTVNGGSADKSEYAEGETVTITANVAEGQRFISWSSDDDVKFDNEGAATTTFVMPKSDVTVKADVKYTVTLTSNSADVVYSGKAFAPADMNAFKEGVGSAVKPITIAYNWPQSGLVYERTNTINPGKFEFSRGSDSIVVGIDWSSINVTNVGDTSPVKIIVSEPYDKTGFLDLKKPIIVNSGSIGVKPAGLHIAVNDTELSYTGQAQYPTFNITVGEKTITNAVVGQKYDLLAEGESITINPRNGVTAGIQIFDLSEDDYILVDNGNGSSNYQVTTASGTVTVNVPESFVEYTVETYTMDTTGNYGEPERETKYAETDSTVSVTPEDKNGFSVDAESVLEGTASADGSTVLKVYYSRNRYDFTTIVDGVEDTKTYYYEEAITAPADPIKAGYTFDGWDNDIPETMPAYDVTVTATFKEVATPEPTNYPLWVGGTQFTSKNLTINGGDGKATYDPESNTLTLTNYTYEGESYGWSDGYFTYGAAIYYGGSDTLNLVLKGTNSVTHTGNASVYSYGMSAKGSITVSGDGSLTATGGEVDGESYGVYADSIIVEGGSLNGTGSTAYNSVGVAAKTDIRALDGSLSGKGSTAIGEDGISYGVVSFGDINVSDGILSGEGGEAVYSYGIGAHDSITVLDGSLTGIGGEADNSYGMAASVNIIIEGGVVIAQGKTQAFYNEPEIADSFTDAMVWYGDDKDAAYTAGAKDKSAITDNYDEKYVRIGALFYTVTFEANGGSVEPETMETVDGKLESLPTPTRSGYNFKGWYDAETDGNKITTDTVFTKDTTVYAQWTKKSSGGGGGGSVATFTVKFDTDGGTEIANKTVALNSKLAEPEAPTKAGYEFRGWYTDKEFTEEYDFNKPVTKSFTLYARMESIGGAGPEGPGGFPIPDWTDVYEDAWYYEDVEYAVENGLFNGITDTTFEPNGIITRAMMVTVLYRAEGEPEMKNAQWFEDVEKGQWYSDAVSWATFNGIVVGYGDGNFGPDDYITREQIATIMHRYAQYKGYDVSVGENTNILSYDDFDYVYEYAIAAMQYAVGSGLMKGKTNTTLNPKDFATRAEIAAILHRFIEANK